MSSIAGLLRVASLLICLTVIASFAIFAFDQTSSASTHQQEELNGAAPTAATHGVNLVLALVVYGFGLGFLARTLRVRV